jgi:hypothetical protein
MTVYAILHNMILRDEWDLTLHFEFNNVGCRVKPLRNLD